MISPPSVKAVFFLVALAWSAGGLLGALPYWLSGALPRFSDALFESVSGFTTTGVSVLPSVEALGRPLLLWRAFSHWLGGMGLVVLTLAVLPLAPCPGGAWLGRLFQAESPGPELDRTRARVSETARDLWLLYAALTALCALLLRLCGMPWFDSFAHALSTLSTGGFCTRSSGPAALLSPTAQWVTIIFMLLGGLSFTLMFRVGEAFTRPRTGGVAPRAPYWGAEGPPGPPYLGFYRGGQVPLVKALRNTEARVYLAIIVGASLLCAPFVGFRSGLFHVVSVMTTTGFSLTDISAWPSGPQAVLFALMFMGGCSGSTAGGIKVIRWVALAKQTRKETLRLLAPKGVFAIRLNGRPADSSLIYGAAGFIALYLGAALGAALVLTSCGLALFQSLNLSLLALGNIGLGLGAPDYGPLVQALPPWAKYFLCAVMITGRLELWPVFAIFSRDWRGGQK